MRGFSSNSESWDSLSDTTDIILSIRPITSFLAPLIFSIPSASICSSLSSVLGASAASCCSSSFSNPLTFLLISWFPSSSSFASLARQTFDFGLAFAEGSVYLAAVADYALFKLFHCRINLAPCVP